MDSKTIFLEGLGTGSIGKMKIAVFHELHKGGARRVVNDFSKELIKRNTVDLYIIDEQKAAEEGKNYSHVYFNEFIPKTWSGGNWKARLYKDTVELYSLYKLHKKIAKLIDSRKYDVVIIHPSRFTQAPFLLRFIRTKKIYYAHEVYRIMYETQFLLKTNKSLAKYLYEYLARMIKQYIDRANVKKTKHIFVNSKNTKANFLKYYHVKTKVFYPCIDLNFFKPSANKKDIDVLFVGSVSDNTDGFFDLKNALNLTRSQFTLKIIGGDIWITDEMLRNFYRRSRLVYCGAYNEPLGLVPLEAASCGVPVVAISEGGYKETIIEGATGSFAKKNPKDIAFAIERILSNKNKAVQMGIKARDNVLKNWAMHKLGLDLENGLKKVIY